MASCPPDGEDLLAIEAHRRARLPRLVYLRHPTTGGVFASWGSLGHITAAEPGALVGFLGPRMYEALYQHTLPDRVQVSEANLLEHGLIDAVVAPEDLRSTAADADVVLSTREGLPDVGDLAEDDIPDEPAWESITRSRRRSGPGCGACCGPPRTA